MATVIKLTGFSGHVIIDDIQVLSGSASLSLEANPSFITLADIQRNENPRGKVLYAPGTEITNGSVNFDVTENSLQLLQLDKLLKRNYFFTVKVFDGHAGRQLDNCYVTSLSVSGSVGGLISASLSFISKDDMIAYNGGSGVFIDPGDTTTEDVPYGYWYSGSTSLQVRDWSLSYSQSVNPVYLNQIGDANNKKPRYLKVGLQEYQLSLTTYDAPPETTDSIVIAANTFSILGKFTSSGYSFNGPTDLGTYSHSFSSAAITFPTEQALFVS